MTWIVEEPVYILVLGGITLAFVVFAWMQTGYRALLHAAIGTAALTAGLLLLERLVVTEAEQIDTTLRQIAHDVERNDHEAIYAHVYSGASDTLTLAQQEFPRYRFDRVNIKRNVEVTLNESAKPPSAHVTFNVTVDVTELAMHSKHHVARYVELTMRKEGGRWTVEQYSHDEPTASMRMHKR